MVFFQGEQLLATIKKVCSGFKALIYTVPISPSERARVLQEYNERLFDLKLVLDQTAAHLNAVLNQIALEVPIWTVSIKKMKAVYHTLNFFNVDVTNKCLIGECWVPKSDIKLVWKALAEGSVLFVSQNISKS